MNPAIVAQIVSVSVGVPVDDILSPLKGSPVTARSRAIVAYILSTECQLTDNQIAKHLKRDRTTISHAIAVIENLRELREFDEYMDELVHSAFNPPKMSEHIRQYFVTAQERDVIPCRPKMREPNLPPKIKSALEIHGIPLHDIIREKPVRNEAISIASRITNSFGQRLYSARRLAPIFGISQPMISRIVRGAANSI